MANRRQLLTLSVSFAAAIAVLATLYDARQNSAKNPTHLTSGSAKFIESSIKTKPPQANFLASSTEHAESIPVATDYRVRFANSKDYWAFAHELLPIAKTHDSTAQYYLFRILDSCAQDNKMYFMHKGERLSLDQGLQYAAQRQLSVDTAQLVFDRCHEFLDKDSTDLGSAADWLAKSTKGGQPLAEATTASNMLLQMYQANSAAVAGATNVLPTESAGDPHELLRAAVESLDPEVLFRIGEAQEMLNPTNLDASTTRLAWWLLACQRGLDCSSNADWVKKSCIGDPQCASADSSGDLVRTLAGDKWPNVQQRAYELNDKLNSRQWDELGIGS